MLDFVGTLLSRISYREPEVLRYDFVTKRNFYVLDQITSSLKSISENYSDILKINTAVVTYLRNAERHESTINENTKDAERTLVREER